MKENTGTLVVSDRLSPQVALVLDAQLARLELLGPLAGSKRSGLVSGLRAIGVKGAASLVGKAYHHGRNGAGRGAMPDLWDAMGMSVAFGPLHPCIPSIGQTVVASSRKGDGGGRATDLAVGGQLPNAVDGETESEGDKAGVGLPV